MAESVLNSIDHQGKFVKLRCSNYETTNRNARVVHALSAFSRPLMIHVACFRHDASGQHVPATCRRIEPEHSSRELCDVVFSVPRDKRVALWRAIDEFVSWNEDAAAESERSYDDSFSALLCD